MFEDLGKKLAKFGQSAMKKTGEVAEIASLQTKIMGKKKKVNDEILELGKKFYEAHKDESTEFTEDIAAINTLYTEIAALEDEMKALKEKLPEGDMADAAAEVMNDIKEAATEVVDSVKEAVSSTAEDVTEAAKETAEDVTEAAKETAEDAAEAVEEAVEAAEEATEEVAEEVAEAAEEAVEKVEDAVEE